MKPPLPGTGPRAKREGGTTLPHPYSHLLGFHQCPLHAKSNHTCQKAGRVWNAVPCNTEDRSQETESESKQANDWLYPLPEFPISINDTCCCSAAKSSPTLCNPMDCSRPGFPALHCLLEFTQTHVHWVGDASNHLILCRPLLLLPSVFVSIRVFSNQLALCVRQPKYQSFSFSISPSNGYSGLISFKID